MKYKISWKSVQSEPGCSMRMVGRKDERTELSKFIVAFRGFVNDRKLIYQLNSSFPAIMPMSPTYKERTASLKNYESVVGCEQDWQQQL
jgi:hypothetical protein